LMTTFHIRKKNIGRQVSPSATMIIMLKLRESPNSRNNPLWLGALAAIETNHKVPQYSKGKPIINARRTA
jgi:hypothetical protein